MGFKIKKFIIVLFFLQISQFAFSENPKILKSSEYPIYGNLNLKLKKDLTLGEEASGPYLFASVNGIEVSKKYIYVLDAKMAKVRVYDLKGKFVRDIGGKGQGPGEFMIPTLLHLNSKGEIYVHDIMTKRMTVFNSEGSYKNSFHIGEPLSGNRIFVDEDDCIYLIFIGSEAETDLNIYFKFAKFNPQGKLEKIFYKDFHLTMICFEEKGMKGNLFYDHPYTAHLYLTNISGDTFVLMNSIRYELILFSKDGDILSKIVKNEKPVKVTKEEKEVVYSDLEKGVPKHLHKYVTFSDTRPYCSDLLSDEKGRIYVERFKPVTEKGGPYIYEIFNRRGEFLYLLALNFKIELIKNGYIYSVSANEETGQIRIFRYRIENWNSVKF